jgi:hypothetical protein
MRKVAEMMLFRGWRGKSRFASGGWLRLGRMEAFRDLPTRKRTSEYAQRVSFILPSFLQHLERRGNREGNILKLLGF